METKSIYLLKISLALFAIIALLYGIIYALAPQLMVEASGSSPVPSGWLRWPGAIMVAIGAGSIMVFRCPSGQGIFVATLALGTLLCGVALVYSALFELEGIGNLWHTLLPGLIILVISLLLWISLRLNRDLLFSKDK
jgi:uncharacterized protein YjeT (DUF2065 family)